MRSNLLKSMLAVFALAVSMMYVGSLAVAAPSFSGGVAAGFGQVTVDDGGTGPGAGSQSAYNAQIESNLIATGKTEGGKVDYYYRLRIRGTQGDPLNSSETESSFSDNQLQTVRTRIGWNVTDAFRIEMGKLPSIGGVGFADIQPLRSPKGFELPVNLYAFYDAGAINFSFKSGSMKFGVAIAAKCDPGCDHSDSTNTSGISTNTGASLGAASTILPYFQGSFGALDVGVRIPSSSAKVSKVGSGSPAGLKLEDQFKSSATGLELRFKTNAVTAAMEYYAKTAKSPLAGAKDEKVTDLTLAAILAMGLQVQYATDTLDNGGTAKPKTTWLSLAYLFDVDGAKFGPEYRSVTFNADTPGSKDVKATMIRFVGTVGL